NCGEMTELDRQFYLFELAISKSHKEKCTELKNDMLKVIKITIPNYDENFDISKHYLTVLELMRINNIAIEEGLLGNKEKAISIMMSLKEYFETDKVDVHEKIKEYPVILSNLSDWLGETERYQECLEVVEDGIKFCVEQGKLVCLSDFLYNKGYCLVKLGKDKEQAKKFILYSIVLGRIGNDSELLELASIFTKENFGEDLVELI
ncbi:MAG: hypothetical protein NC548_55615, partial [Lachnospiraceae bacterium]|nr:hypothetical protein [Lachnospiraceae bacterium]